MRFSLKWMLAGMVYVAISAAAFGTGKWYFVDAVKSFSLLIIVYCIGLAVAARGRVQVSAICFLAATFGFLASLRFSGRAPLLMLLLATGAQPGADMFDAQLRTANAVATLAFGLMGSLVGLLAFRAAGRDSHA
jgi:hypothetical protein